MRATPSTGSSGRHRQRRRPVSAGGDSRRPTLQPASITPKEGAAPARASAQQIAASASGLSRNAEELERLVSEFRLTA
jgi:hypothetical protein